LDCLKKDNSLLIKNIICQLIVTENSGGVFEPHNNNMYPSNKPIRILPSFHSSHKFCSLSWILRLSKPIYCVPLIIVTYWRLKFKFYLEACRKFVLLKTAWKLYHQTVTEENYTNLSVEFLSFQKIERLQDHHFFEVKPKSIDRNQNWWF